MKYASKALLLAGFWILFSCDGGKRLEMDAQELFSLNLGRMENEIDFIEIDESPYARKTRLYMKNGLFYLGSGNANKVMELSSYGELISLLYNPSENPEPILLATDLDQDTLSNRRAVPFPFTEVGEIAVDSNRNLIVEDRVADSRVEFDQEFNVRLERVVRRFNRMGEQIDFLGQDGIGGKPFPYIHDIVINQQDDIIVVCMVPQQWIMYWFSSEGRLRYTFRLPSQNLPAPPVEGLIQSLETITPDLEDALVYLKIDYYNPLPPRGNGEYFGSYIHWFNMETSQYEGYIEIPRTFRHDTVPGLGSETGETDLYHILGVAKKGILFLISTRDNDLNQILAVDRYGKVLNIFSIFLKEKDIVYRDFYLTPEGVLVAYLCREFGVDFMWWRFDKYIQGYDGENSQ
ncbi:MAG: hypothetical protein JXB03_04940 [Spirochaetales bacterium]|nr:hypothetical protein [Spirochaetales bacterium]